MKVYDHGGNIYAHDGKKILDFSANINPLGVHAKGLNRIACSLDSLIHYPDPYSKKLKEKISQVYHVAEESIVVSNGASELLMAFCAAFGRHKAYVVNPTFSEYGHCARAYGLEVHDLASDKNKFFKVTKELWSEIFSEGLLSNSLIFLGHPNNPDGQMLNEDILLYILDNLGYESYLLVDESFIDFCPPGTSFRHYIEKYPNLIILHSFTKFFAIPGLRLGAAYMTPLLVQKLETFIPTWSVNRLSQLYGEVVLDDEVYRADTCALVSKEKNRLLTAFQSIKGISPIRGAANFMLCHLDRAYDYKILEHFLYKNDILIRNCSNYKNLRGSWFRIAIKGYDENQFLLTLLKEFFND